MLGPIAFRGATPILGGILIPDEAVIETPCQKICLLDPTAELCRGCGRSLNEIARWTAYSDRERKTIMAELPRRLEIMGRTVPESR